MDGLQAPSAPGEQPEMAESVSLARLLIAAKSLSSEKEDLPVADTKMSPDADLDPPADMTTAKAILARAIEILDDIDNESVQPVVGGVEADVALRPFLVRNWRSTRRLGYTCQLAHCRRKTAEKISLRSEWCRNRPRHVNLSVRCRQSRSLKHPHCAAGAIARLCRPDAGCSGRQGGGK